MLIFHHYPNAICYSVIREVCVCGLFKRIYGLTALPKHVALARIILPSSVYLAIKQFLNKHTRFPLFCSDLAPSGYCTIMPDFYTCTG